MTILDAFHFEACALGLEEGEEGERKGQPTGTSGVTEKEREGTNHDGNQIEETQETYTDIEMVEKEEMEVSGEVEDDLRQKSIAQRIHRTIIHSILPSLQEILTKKVAPDHSPSSYHPHIFPSSQADDTPGHKLSRLGHNEESEVLRVPVAMAMTKLLLALPESTLHTHLPGYKS